MARPSTLHYLSYDNTETLNRILTDEVRAKLEEYSRLNPASISIQNLLDHGQTATQRVSNENTAADHLLCWESISTIAAKSVVEIDSCRSRSCSCARRFRSGWRT